MKNGILHRIIPKRYRSKNQKRMRERYAVIRELENSAREAWDDKTNQSLKLFTLEKMPTLGGITFDGKLLKKVVERNDRAGHGTTKSNINRKKLGGIEQQLL